MGQRSLLNAGSNPAGLNGYSPLELLKESSMATLQREASRMGGGMISDPNMQDRFSFSLMAPPPSRADMMMGGEQVMGMMPMAGITAFHGSPHKFSKFDMSKIGTGEGAQAYGHGLYFAENPNVAKGYDEAGSHMAWDIDGQRYHGQTTRMDAGEGNFAANALDRFDGDVDKAIDWLDDYGMEAEAKGFLRRMKRKKASIDKAEGNLYKVDIPDDQIAKMLDWDKPLSEQSYVMSKLQSQSNNDAVLAGILKDIDKEGRGVGGAKYRGEDLLRDYESYGELSQPEISNILQQQGIPGIKYLDGVSRSGGKGTSNFVLFDDQLPTIESINDQPIGLIHGR